MTKKVLVAMSGGIDSSVAALILKEQGYYVKAITMQLEMQDNNICKKIKYCFSQKLEDIHTVCEIIGIDYCIINYTLELEKKVIFKFINEYGKGKTPNPCIDCNRYIKFGILLKQAKSMGFNYLATGHYAMIKRNKKDNTFNLLKSKDLLKDQSYFLYVINPNDLESIIFPLANYTKSEIKLIAKKQNFPSVFKKESQDLCFVKDNNLSNFFQKRAIKLKTGPICTLNGNYVGKHKGIQLYTVGQRSKLEISSQKPLYVISIDSKLNKIFVGSRNDLTSQEIIVNDILILSKILFHEKYIFTAKIRYRQDEVFCKIKFINNKNNIHVFFLNPQEAITPGQAIVFYYKNIVLGGATIYKIIK